MTDRVFVHIGLPKTATSYLQTIIWSNRDALRERGIVVPGAERRDHLWASRTVREQRWPERASQAQRTAWDRVRAELAGASGTGLIGHEFFAAAAAEQAVAMVSALAPAEVHLVVTAREPLGLFTASWQESLKNGSTTPMPAYAREVSPRPTDIWNWRTLDLRLVLERWGQAVPADRIHVLVLDPRAGSDDVWHRFAGIVGFETDGIDLSGSFPNTSMGVVEAETLRRVNERVSGFDSAFDKGVYLRTFLADERLVPRGGDRFWPSPIRSRSAGAAVATPWPIWRRPAWTSSVSSPTCSSPMRSPRAAARRRSPTRRSPRSRWTSSPPCSATSGRCAPPPGRRPPRAGDSGCAARYGVPERRRATLRTRLRRVGGGRSASAMK